MTTLKVTSAYILFALALAFALVCPELLASRVDHLAAAARAAQGQPVAPTVNGTILRTLVYHEITSLNQSPVAGTGGTSQAVPILSWNGNRAAFVLQTGPVEFRLFVINADGSGQREVDSYTNIGGVPLVDISADGSKVLSSAGRRIRLVNADGANPHDVIQVSDGFIQIRLSADGTKVFFTNDRNFSVGSENLTKGLYVINADGSGRRQIVSGANIGTLLNAPPGGFNFVGTSGTTLDVSADTSHILFGTSVDGKGQYLLGVNFDGSGLHQILGPADRFDHAAISGDGLKVAYDLTLPPCCSTPGEAGVINFDGTQRKPLVTNVNPFNQSLYPSTGVPMQLSADGSRLLFGTGVLFSTATGEALQLAARGGSFSNDPPFLVEEGMRVATMNGSATRFLYLAPGLNNALQLATLDINPGGLGAAPNVTDPQIDPTYVITQGRGRATLSARVSATNTLVRVNNSILFKGLTSANAFNGLTDNAVSWLVLSDGGANGDTTAGDGVFTNNQLSANCCAVLGPRLVRVKAEVRASDNKRHATAIDFEPLAVTDQVPSIDVSQTSLDFGSVIVGQSKDLTFIIRNIGTNQLTVNSLTSNNSQFTVPSPTAPFTLAPGGQQIITVRFTPNAVGPQGGRLTINSADPARPNIDVFLSGVGVNLGVTVNDHRITGGPIPGACDPPVTKTGFAPTDAQALQWTFVSGFQNGAIIRWEWVQPNGAIYRRFETPVNNPNQHVCFWDAIGIAGQAAASLPGNWQVRVFYNGAQIVTDTFTISGASSCPTVSGINPTSGAAGANVTITGANFTGVAAVRFANNLSANFTVNSDTQITATVPSGAVTGPITITKPNCPDAQTGAFTICAYTISPTSQSFAAGGGSGSVTVTTQPGCAWTATSNAGFITITSGSPGNGSGTLNYSVAANTGASSRSGTLTIAGQTFTVNQSGASAGAPMIRIEPTTLSFNVARGQSATSAPPVTNRNDPGQAVVAPEKNEQEREREEEGDRVQERLDWFYRQRQYPFDRIPERARELAILEKARAQERLRAEGAEEAKAAAAAQWTPIGPSVTTSGAWGRVSGRITSIIVHPANPNIVYIGGAQGGVWRTTDNGASWTPLTDDQPSLALGALAFDPNNPNVIYAGTGEQNFSLDSYEGNGVLKSVNGGVTWSVLGAATFARQTIGRIAVSPANSQVALAAASNGLYRSANGGTTWTSVLAGVATDVIATPGSGSAYYAAIRSGGVFKSTDGGLNWTKLTAGLPAGGFGRVHLAISTAAPNTLLASFTRNDFTLEGLYRSADAGASWTKLTSTPNVFGKQGWYNVSLAIHPANANIIYFGGLSLWRTQDGGANWANVSNPRDYFLDVHPDQHALAFNPQNPSVVWLGCDGGAWRSDNGGDAWLSRNEGLSLTQFQTVALHPTNDSLAFGGTQDNGIQKYTGTSEWRETRTGDNGSTYFDFNTPTTIYTTYIGGYLLKSLAAGDPGTWDTAFNGIPRDDSGTDGGRTAFYAPFTMDPANPQRLAFGSYRVWHTSDGAANWTAVSGDVTGGGVISAITIASNGARIWTGSSDAQVWRGDLSGGAWSWTNVTKAPLPGRFITRIAAHPTDPQTAYISYSGFGVSHVFRTTDGGATWTNASGGLPDIPVNVVLVDPNNAGTAYAGTDIGVYRSTDQGQNWAPYGAGLPNVAVFDLAIRKNGSLLRVATHGRGMWEVQTSGEQSFTIYNDGNATLTVTGVTKQNNAAWLSFTTASALPFDIAPGASAPVRVSVNATGLNAGLFTDRLLVTSNDTARSPYPTGVFINLTVTDGGGGACNFTIAPTAQNFNASGGSGSVNVTAPNGCLWTAAADDSWITITSGASGAGAGAVNYSVAANTSASPRAGTLTIAGQTFTVAQLGGSNCAFTIAPTSQNFTASGGNGSVNVTTQSGCGWNASSNAGWIVLTSGASGAGAGVVNYTVAANNTTGVRSGTLTIAGQILTVTQSGGSNCVFTITPANQFFPASGGSGGINVSTQSECRWTAQSNDGWIVITSGASGSGGGAVSYIVAANNSSIPRAGTITVAGQTFIIGQAGTGATCGLLPISIGQTVNGELVTTDCRSPIFGQGYYADLWYFTASAGQQVAIQLTSSQFDAYLTLIGPDGEVVDEDDDGGGGTNARIPATSGFLTLPQDGTYLIEASSAFVDEIGRYTLSLTAPTGCTFTVAPASQNFSASGGSGAVNVTTQSGCAWDASSNAGWIAITSGASGAGNGAVSYSVAANTSASSRTGALTIAGQTFTVTQSGGSNCAFTIAPTGQSFNPSGGNGSVNVSTQSGCNWTARSNTDWITITSGSSGSGNGAVNYSVAANNGVARAGAINVAGQTFTVTQSASGNCNYTLTPASQSFTASGGSGAVNVTASAGCAWAAATGAAWITLQTGTDSGAGNGSVGYSVAANNTGNSRSGTITIAGQTFTITQSGGGGANCPTVSGVNPSSGQIGSTVTITGANFTGVTAVRFSNNVAAQFTVNSDTQITATAPNGAVTGPITISKPNCPDAQTGAFTVTPTGSCLAVSIPTNLAGSPNSALTVPINVSDTTGKNALSYDAVLTFNPAALRLQNPAFDRSGTLSANLNVTINSPSAGRLNISGFSSSPLTGAGVLLYLKFDVIGSLNACSDLNWTSFRFNEGTPCSTTSNGRACASGGGSIAGLVSYCAANPSKPVPGVTITASGSPSGSATTDGSGNYQLPNLGGGPYTLTPTKTGDANGITSFDAAQIAQQVVGLITLNDCQRAAADTSGNGEITSFDAAFIAQFVVGITNPDNKTGTWKFLPPTRAYSTLNGNQTAQNFDAVLLGELTGNWTPGGGNALLTGQSLINQRALSPAQVAISLPQVSASTGSSVTIPITVGDLTGRNFLSFDFDLTYDASVLQAQPQPTDSTDTLARNLTITANATPGRLRVSGFGAQAMTGAGTLLKLRFNVTGAAGTGTALTWQRFIFNETPQTSLTNGRVNASPAVASVSAASFAGGSLAAESIVAAFGAAMATRVEVASTLPLPTTLAGTTVRVRDSAGTERLSALFFVAPTQINFQIPPGTVAGQATITVTSGDGTVSSGSVTIASVAPGFFTANASGQGVAAATVLRVKADGTQVFEPVARFDAAQNRFVAAPIDLGPESEQVFLILFGTGFRQRSSLSATTLSIGGINVEVLYAGAQGDFVGLDQVNARLPRSLIGRGEVNVALMADARPGNVVSIHVR